MATRREIIRLSAAGLSQREIGTRVGVTQTSVWRVMAPLGGAIRPERWKPSPARLSLDERVEIALALQRGRSFREIASALGRCASTVCREVNANGGPSHYRPIAAHRRAFEAARRPKVSKLATNPRLLARVAADLEKLWSPEQIARRLRVDFVDDVSMHVSHETIYRSLYVQGRGELRRELARCLRTGRARRRSRGRVERRGRIADMILISERPPDARDRAVPGHWEGDIIIGKANKSAIGTLVERTTRYVMLLHLPNGASAEEVRLAMTKTIATLPRSLRRSLTTDQGMAFAEHARFTTDTGLQVYFCDPRSPWQRGSNENTNGLLRQYFPKGTDLSVHSAAKLTEVADSLNSRPRKTLNWMTPSEKFAEFVAPTV